MKYHLLHLLATFTTVAVPFESAKKIVSHVVTDKRILVFLDLL